MAGVGGWGSSSSRLSIPSLQFGGLSSVSEDVCSRFHLPAALHSLSRGANPLHLVAPAGFPTPFLSAPLCFTQHVRVPGFRPLPSLALESPTVHTRKWREGNRAPSPQPPTLILPIWKKLYLVVLQERG